ncbi:MAG: hypothetical protein PVH45_03115 [Candidatus Omnitrophota bacterium]|jgi:hypothetical protein
MIKLFLFSIVAGVILAAPFGPCGALVADAALLRDRKRLETTIFGAVSGNACLALLVSLIAGPMKAFLAEHRSILYIGAGIAMVVLAVIAGVAIATGKASGETYNFTKSPARSFKLGVSVAGVFFITILHPGSIMAFLILTSFFALRFSDFSAHRFLYTTGIAAGSLIAFSPVGIVFWIIREKAKEYILRLRYGLAAFIGLAGVYCLSRGIGILMF